MYQVGGIDLPTEDKKNGSGFQLYGDISNIYDIGKKNGYAVKNKLSVYGKKFISSENSNYDIGYVLYNPSLIYKVTKYMAELEGGFDILFLGSTKYLQSLSLSPKFEWNHTSTLRSLTYFKYIDKKYLQTLQKDLDAAHYELSYALQKILTPRSYLQVQGIGMQEKKQHGTRVDVDFSEYKLNLNYANQFNSTFGIELFGAYQQRSYKDYSNIFSSKREDKGGAASVSINTQVKDLFKVRVKILYNKIDSNQEIYSYSKNTFTVGFVKTF